MECSICINTYKRPKLLEKLLDSLSSQTIDRSISIEIIIVDNDPLELGRNIVEKFATSVKYSVRYFSQPIKNISITRNKAIKEAKGKFIFFIDDDEYADSNWILTNLNCVNKYDADAVFGSVISYFDPSIPIWIKSNKMFHREVQKTGTIPKYTRTGNCLVKAELLKTIEGPFDIEYGVTGGSDSHLFTILSNRGAKFVYCQESKVYEYVPQDRANLRWLIKRAQRTGNSFARRSIELSNSRMLLKSYLLLKATILGLFNLILSMITLFSKKLSSSFFVKSAGYLGHIGAIFYYHPKEYK